jgi:hypothetical protein
LSVFFASRGLSQEACADFLRENALDGGERAENLEADAFLSLAKSFESMRI